MGKIFCIIGKSSSGKDTIYRKLLSKKELHLQKNVMYTTRPMRNGEQDGIDYYYVDIPFFQQAKLENRVVESRIYQTVYGPWTYFTMSDHFDLEKNDYLVVNTLEGFLSLKKYFGENQIIPLYVYIPDILRLERALHREKKEAKPKVKELCRRFLQDEIDFSNEKLALAQIPNENCFENINFDECLYQITSKIEEYQTQLIKIKNK